MIENYFNIDLKKTGIFLGTILGTTLITTLLFWWIFGFDQWTQNFQTASDLLTAAAVAPAVQMQGAASNAGQFVCPIHGASGMPNYDQNGTPHCPVCGTMMQFHNLQQTPANIMQAAAG